MNFLSKLALLVFFLPFLSKSQCFEIQSILVDACDGGNEGKNEMVQFKVGSAALNTANLNVNWPNNSYLGICQNATTTAAVAQINSTILGCGLLVEPVGGVLPANSTVLLISSVDFNPAAQSFVGLTTTLVVIFQCPGNTSGHFANYTSITTPSVAVRTLSMSFSSPPGCSDVVSYNRNNLLNQSQVPGAQDGGAVMYDAPGTPTYVNNGCTAPFTPLSITASASSTAGAFCMNTPVNITSTVSGGTFNSITWAGGTGTFAATTTTSTSNTYTPGSGEIGVVSLSTTVTRTCAAGSQSAASVFTLNIITSPTVSFSNPLANICSNQSATFVANTDGTIFNWNTGQTTNSIVVSPTVNTVYSFTSANSCGQTPATVTVNTIANPTITIGSSSNTLCAGNSVTLTASSSPGTYTWNNGSNAASIVVSPSVNAIYTASTANTCSLVTASNVISVTPQPTLSLNASMFNICGTQTANIIATAASGTFSWSNGAATNSINATMGGVYSVTVTNACNSVSQSATVNVGAAPAFSINASSQQVCPSQSITLTPAGSTGTLSWNTGATTPTLIASTAGVYSATLANNCGTAVNSITLTAATLPTLTLSQSTNTICSGGSITLTATGSSGTYSWNTSATATSISVNQVGIYSATVTNVCGSSDASVSVIPGPAPTVSIIPSSALTCNGQTATLTANSLSGGVSYSWSQGSASSVITASSAGMYTAIASNSCGTGTATYNLVFAPLPTVSLTSSAYILCSDSTAILSASGTGGGTFNWPLFLSNTTPLQQVNSPGTYVVTYSNACGTAQASVYISSSTLTPDFIFSPLTSDAPATINFTNQSQNNILNAWNLGNGQSSLTPDASGTYLTPGIYSVTLLIENPEGCRASVTKTIDITFTSLGQVPELITPNGDGHNDHFVIKGLENYPLNHLQIFNRWGSPVFSAMPYTNNWDGSPNAPGKSGSGRLPSGTYFYLLDLNDGNNTFFKGFIQVVY